jgi:hypothetical protein
MATQAIIEILEEKRAEVLANEEAGYAADRSLLKERWSNMIGVRSAVAKRRATTVLMRRAADGLNPG